MTVYTVTEPAFKEYIGIYQWQDPHFPLRGVGKNPAKIMLLPAADYAGVSLLGRTIMPRTNAGAWPRMVMTENPIWRYGTQTVSLVHFGIFIRPISPRGWTTQDPSFIRRASAETEVEITTAADGVIGSYAGSEITPVTQASAYVVKGVSADLVVSPVTSVAVPIYMTISNLYDAPNGLTFRFGTRSDGYMSTPAVVLPTPPTPAPVDPPDPEQPGVFPSPVWGGITIRSLYGTVVDMADPTITDGKPT